MLDILEKGGGRLRSPQFAGGPQVVEIVADSYPFQGAAHQAGVRVPRIGGDAQDHPPLHGGERALHTRDPLNPRPVHHCPTVLRKITH